MCTWTTPGSRSPRCTCRCLGSVSVVFMGLPPFVAPRRLVSGLHPHSTTSADKISGKTVNLRASADIAERPACLSQRGALHGSLDVRLLSRSTARLLSDHDGPPPPAGTVLARAVSAGLRCLSSPYSAHLR